ncbi:MAG TPA: winged helix-turn-helix transcriptional regulator [Candidatus Avacidaminococcus intestinavium]|uniref:Winged helix-turn-helix transcriptional regulator n=1 Tax=Candidatus Avacidaminococcus intestinavium TaxID=2840684 RepID=A0A9D1SME6_9FIRM|nr:winged helix-turn-helix transcriptional regulator [Candidatus Avacidaminococcus intestinavium]
MEMNLEIFEEQASFLRVLAHPVRLCIVKGLYEKGECNVSHMQNCLNVPQSTVSQHLQKLKSEGIVKSRRKGLEIYYQINDIRIKKIVEALF